MAHFANISLHRQVLTERQRVKITPSQNLVSTQHLVNYDRISLPFPHTRHVACRTFCSQSQVTSADLTTLQLIRCEHYLSGSASSLLPANCSPGELLTLCRPIHPRSWTLNPAVLPHWRFTEQNLSNCFKQHSAAMLCHWTGIGHWIEAVTPFHGDITIDIILSYPVMSGLCFICISFRSSLPERQDAKHLSLAFYSSHRSEWTLSANHGI